MGAPGFYQLRCVDERECTHACKISPLPAEGAGPNNFVSVPAGTVVLGKPVDFPSYGWDNEYGRMDVR